MQIIAGIIFQILQLNVKMEVHLCVVRFMSTGKYISTQTRSFKLGIDLRLSLGIRLGLKDMVTVRVVFKGRVRLPLSIWWRGGGVNIFFFMVYVYKLLLLLLF